MTRFYERVANAIEYIADGYNIRIILVGGGTRCGGSQHVPKEYVDAISNIVSSIWSGSEIPRILVPQYSFRRAFLAMIHADVLIGSGSSLPMIASAISAQPLYFNHVPKHGFNYGMEMMIDNADLLHNGTVLDSLKKGKRLPSCVRAIS